VKMNNEILARHTGKPLATIEKDTDRDRFMSPEEAKDYGIIDAVYSVPGASLIAQAHDAGLAGGGDDLDDALDGVAAVAGQIAWILFLVGVVLIIVHMARGGRHLPPAA